MLRPLLVNPLLILGVALAGAGICRLARVPVHGVDVLAAAGIGLVAAEAAVLVAVSRRGANAAQTAMTALVAMALQMLLSIVLAAIMIFTHQVGPAFVWWMLVMFWVTLVGVSAVLVKVVRAAATTSATPTGNPTRIVR